MASNIFDNLQSPVSYDAEFDKGWRAISEKGDEPIKAVFQLLQRVYWAAVEDEMANAILAFDDYKKFVPGGLPELAEGALESDYLRELLDLWDPMGLPPEIKNNVAISVLNEVKGSVYTIVSSYLMVPFSHNAERQKAPQDATIARSLLQACGFTDYDYVQEHPGGALISTRALPTLGNHSPREVLEYLHPENYKTIQGCDVFCAQVYSVCPERRIYEATKRAKGRRFLCSRKQFSGGLFTDYNYSRPSWRSAEDRIVQQFLRIATIWRTEKSPIAHESANRTLLQECAERLAESLEIFFAEEINLHLFLLAQKLGKTQKLTYSRMSNNCQDFCNGLLSYDNFTDPVFNAMYPFIPVSLAADIEKEPDDMSLSYLQSFVKPLQYPIPGSSKRAMLGSAVTMYSSYAQNDADLIDHVYSVRFGSDSTDGFSLGFGDESPAADHYLLKDEEMSCSDRFAAVFKQESSDRGSCTLADHLLDCPVDNLSVLQTHLHRQKKYYINEDREFLSNLPPSAWMTNRLQVLRRLKLLNDFLADIAAHFQECCRLRLPNFGVTDVKTLRKIWRPDGTAFSRAWHMDKRHGSTLYFAQDIDFGTGEMDNYKAVGFLTFGATFMQTHRQLMGGDEIFMTRLKRMKSMLMARVAGKEEDWSPWKWCTCDRCKMYKLHLTCYRVDWTAVDNQNSLERGEPPVTSPGHPDYTPPMAVERMLRDQEYGSNFVSSDSSALEVEEQKYEKAGSEWPTTYLLALRIIFKSKYADLGFLRWRLEEYTKLAAVKKEK
ncbi:hypothetical protein BJY04DRAFT_217155 [Aspergillus karnatakaensis]|uniref:uncharacterized protein n=1 Tax=Aspergillus karnatakaensis TaxID=1810916 RepID=UPI003CCD0445